MKPEYEPLFDAGFKILPLSAVRKFCVDAFPLSSTRSGIMNGLEMIVGTLEAAGIIGELWVDGGFLTKKIDPEDVDVVLRVAAEVYDSGTPEQRQAIDWIDTNLKAALSCDSYKFFEYPAGHALRAEGEWDYAYWVRQFGFSRDCDYKGIVVIKLTAKGP